MDAGLIVIVASIAPFRRDRETVRARLPDGRFGLQIQGLLRR
jgi:adenylylsulfate kinase-like enzyme